MDFCSPKLCFFVWPISPIFKKINYFKEKKKGKGRGEGERERGEERERYPPAIPFIHEFTG